VNFYEHAEDVTALPGTENGPYCGCNSYYFESEDNINELLKIYSGSESFDYRVNKLLYNFSFTEKVEVMQLICSRYQFGGDLSGSGSILILNDLISCHPRNRI
jgi:hypothetical protein